MDIQNTLMMAERIRKQQQSRKRIESLPGYKIWIELWSSRMSFLILVENNRSTKISIKRLNTIDLPRLPLEVRWREQRKLVKDLHNVIGSGQSLKDHLHYRNNYSSDKEITDLTRFFKALRNFLIHNDSFELTSRINSNIETGTRRYQAMGRGKFLRYLESRICKLSTTDSHDMKEKKQLEKVITYVNQFPNLIDFESLYYDYFDFLIAYRNNWLKKFIKTNKKHLIELAKEVEQYHLESFSILTKVQLRYLNFLLYKYGK